MAVTAELVLLVSVNVSGLSELLIPNTVVAKV
jgi:hypothetical protein